MSRALADRARHFQLTARRPVKNLLAGLYASAFKGVGLEFDEVRAYIPGDDVRTIDWRVTARMKEPFVRRYIEERQLTLWLLIDCSASLRIGPETGSKAETAWKIATLLAFTAAHNHDRVGLVLFTDRIEHIEPPRQGMRHVHHVLEKTISFPPKSKGTDLGKVLNELRGFFKKNQLLFLISDFQSADFGEALRRTAFRQNLHAVYIRHQLEAELPSVGLLRIRDAESGETLLRDTFSKATRGQFKRAARKRHRELLNHFAANGIEPLDLTTLEDPIQSLAVYLKRIEKKGGIRHAPN